MWLTLVISVVIDVVVALLFLACDGERITTLTFKYSISVMRRP